MELPRYEAEGAPAGVKLAAEEGGGGPAGVVEGLSPKKLIELPRELRSGVEGGELSPGTSNRFDIPTGIEGCARSSSKSRQMEEEGLKEIQGNVTL